MKKVIVVSKTHLDLGFTDYAESIRRKYIDTFIPEAIDLAERVNTDAKKHFVWTTYLKASEGTASASYCRTMYGERTSRCGMRITQALIL